MPPKKRKAAEAAISDSPEGTRVFKSQRVNARPKKATAAVDRPRRSTTSTLAATDPKVLKSHLTSTSKNAATKFTNVPTGTEPPKKRGRPPKSSAKAPKVSSKAAPKSPAKGQTPKSPTAKAIPKAKVTSDGGIRKRGRPPKGATTLTKAKPQGKGPETGMRPSLRLEASSNTPTSKVAFAKATTTISATPTGSGKPRGRPPKKSILKNGSTADDEANTTKASKSGIISKAKKAASKTKSKDQEAVQPEVAANGEEGIGESDAEGKSFWLMKAEPDSRLEKGVDVKFSIDDLKEATEPQGWDGVRNLAARNNMRAMKKGDLALFYHSNCKVPGIVGIMEIVEEHSVDESAFDENHPYYDQNSDRENPKWSLVHVEFRSKFPQMITLADMRSYAKPGGALESLQTLKQSRLSVSKVSAKEWDFIMTLQEELSSPEATLKSPLHVPTSEPQSQLAQELEDQIIEQEQAQDSAQDEAGEDGMLDEEEEHDDPTMEGADEGNLGDHTSE